MAMAYTSKVSLYLNMAVILSFLLIITMAESRSTPSIGFSTVKAAPSCDTVYGVQSEDTCFGIAQTFKLTTEFFDSINPNINCAAIFVGQWRIDQLVIGNFKLKVAMAEAAPSCDTWFVVRSEDTCFSIAQAFRLTSDSFVMLNPNLSCTALSVGQWVCVDGTVD
ncbi:hypothetical protein RJ639_009838 [Escallonia herrerae]|uniref:LysM domain-containing protein n=1 Tax=Escallonia herrerae TaxID=1293975 RepID=A0AA88VTF7_9ASTE|nr:hypothetical protein RJ639_009838 [Escallonia herrerae]